MKSSAATRLFERHGYLSGNYAPVKQETPLTPCTVVEGSVPKELARGQYVRNGGNPMANENLARESHWFDGDGMLSGVFFQEGEKGRLMPQFINRYIVTDVLLATSQKASRPILPSIATLSSPATSLIVVLCEVFRSVVLCLLTWIPFTWTLALGKGTRRLSKISVANTNVYYHDGKVLAACESGPPMRVVLPSMETADWWTGDEGKSFASGIGPMQIFSGMTTAHPHTDQSNKELLLYHSSFVAPYLRISVMPPRASRRPALVGATVPGMKEGKLMHDFAATRSRTVVLDLPLSLDPRNLLVGRPIVHYDPKASVRFGIFPRREPHKVQWYSDPTACCIYHTANCWDEGQTSDIVKQEAVEEDAVNFLACRLNSATLVYSAGNVIAPDTARPPQGQEERCELYYWRFAQPPIAEPPSQPPILADAKKSTSASGKPSITHSFPLSRVPFEFPTINLQHAPAAGLGPNRYIYGCSMREGTFDAGMGRNSAKIDCLVKMDAQSLVKKGRRRADAGKLGKDEAVDSRLMPEILQAQREHKQSNDSSADDIAVFAMPEGWYAQESTFVPRHNAKSEDDGYLIFFAFDEKSNLDPLTGEALPTATSQLWIIDAKDMQTIVSRIELPQRVPYGLHGKWFSPEEIDGQEAVDPDSIRQWALRADSSSHVADEKAQCGLAVEARRSQEEANIKLQTRNAGILANTFTALREYLERLA